MEDADSLDFHFSEQEKELLMEGLILLQQEFFRSEQWINISIEEYLFTIDTLMRKIETAKPLNIDETLQ